MFERLTYWNEEYGCWSYKCASGDAANRLAAYEDSGLSPEQVQELAKAKADGRLVVLPCNVGDIVYAVCCRDIIGWEVYQIEMRSDAPDKYYACGDDEGYAADEMYFEESDIGKTVFLSREAAEKAIAEGDRQMKITIDSMLRLEDMAEEILEQIKAELTIRNPDYDKKRRMGLNRWAWGPEYIKLISEKTINGHTQHIIPRGYYARFWMLAAMYDFDIIDNRLSFPRMEYPKKPQLRDYQAPAIPLAQQWQQGCVIMPCGAGKTVAGMGIIAELGQPTLWVTHTMDLLQQSMNAAISFLGLTGSQIGLIQGKNMKIGSHITFATVQTLSKRNLSEIREKFGCVVVDESHLCYKSADKARQFESVISQFPAYYRFGMTASEHRADGLIETMFAVIGPKFYEVAQDDPRLSVMTPKVEFIETDFYYEQGIDEDGDKEMLSVQQMYKAMREDDRRNTLLGKVLKNKIVPGDCCLALGDSLEHLQQLCGYVRGLGRNAAYVCGETPKKERESIMTAMRAGQYQFLFATYALAKLGLDIPRLNKLVLITPHRDKTTIQQAVGRIMRPFEGKTQPVVYDIYDSRVKQLVYWARERVRVYKRLGCRVSGGPVVRKW